MTMAMTIDVLPASRGDCLWVECQRPGRPWRLLVDGGMPDVWPVLRERITALPPAERIIDLAVVSHIDADHIGGMLPLFAANDLGVTFGDVWFNGLPQLPDDNGSTRGVKQGESLVALFSDATAIHAPPWNKAFGGAAVMTSGDGDFSHVHRPDWPAITLLSPTPKRLAKLRQVWEAELERVRRGEPPEEIPPSVPRASLDDLERLAATPTTNDNAAANGSSIAFLLEHQGASCLLTADAFSSVLGAALTGLANERGGNPLDIDVLKLPHHGSKSNVSSALIRLIPARNYVVSTNSELFHHPDDVALARVVTAGPPGLALWFNYLTDATLRWDDRTIKQRYGFESHYPIDGSGGVRIELPGSG